jgi:glycosyltransferase involved in cell wall biosynthesis
MPQMIIDKFSVLLSIYHKEKVHYFEQCMGSIWNEQSVKPDQIVLVLDGPLPEGLNNAIENWKSLLGDVLLTIPLHKNIGLGGALKIGLKECQYDLVARMDTDDVSTPERFKKQIEFLKSNDDIDVVGTFIKEIDEFNNVVKDVVVYPKEQKDLFIFFQKRDPIAHPTAMFRKSYFEKAGTYSSELLLAEDTLLWYKGFLNHCNFANIDYIGLHFRRESAFYKRRGGFKKSYRLFLFRYFEINKNLNFGLIADIYAFLYFLMGISPSFIKKIVYNFFR